MAAGQRLYPRATVKKIVKAHSKRNVSKNVDVLVCPFDASRATQLTFSTDLPRLYPLSANVRAICSNLQDHRAEFAQRYMMSSLTGQIQVDEGG
jgi:hypothetical protein